MTILGHTCRLNLGELKQARLLLANATPSQLELLHVQKPVEGDGMATHDPIDINASSKVDLTGTQALKKDCECLSSRGTSTAVKNARKTRRRQALTPFRRGLGSKHGTLCRSLGAASH